MKNSFEVVTHRRDAWQTTLKKLPKMPRDEKGHFISRDCPRLNCGGGRLQYEEDKVTGYGGIWVCDGLTTPEREDQELDACTYCHIDGEPKQE